MTQPKSTQERIEQIKKNELTKANAVDLNEKIAHYIARMNAYDHFNQQVLLKQTITILEALQAYDRKKASAEIFKHNITREMLFNLDFYGSKTGELPTFYENTFKAIDEGNKPKAKIYYLLAVAEEEILFIEHFYIHHRADSEQIKIEEGKAVITKLQSCIATCKEALPLLQDNKIEEAEAIYSTEWEKMKAAALMLDDILDMHTWEELEQPLS